MKTCNRCSTEKSLDAFAKNGPYLHPVCKVCRATIERARRETDGARIREQEKARYARDPSIKKRSTADYYQANRTALLAKEKARAALAPEKILEVKRAYRAANPDKIRASNGTRRARERQAMPAWADLPQIKAVYMRATELWAQTGIPHHVDHIIPLTNKLVCGLHVSANLQVLTASENSRKNNRFSE
jgi:5-methylcytosine-specific restriction endonuclease McrA